MSSEEKDLPASQKKLRKAREKGEVAQSRDLTTALALIVAVVYVISRLGELLTELMGVWQMPIDLHDAGLEEAIRRSASGFSSAALHFVIPLLAATVGGAFFADMLMKKGLVIAIEPLMPKFDRIDPVKGFERMFKVAKLIELAKALVKLAVLGIGGTLALSGFLNALMWLPQCGIRCIGGTWAELAKVIAGLAIIIFAINGLVDMRVQIWLFLRDQRMTKTEAKREHKDDSPNPEVKRAARKQMQPKGQGKSAVQQAVLVLGDSSVAIGVRFVADETPAPVCVCKGRGPAAKRIIDEADQHGIPVHNDRAFTEGLFKNTRVMNVLPPVSYRVIAQIFKQYKII